MIKTVNNGSYYSKRISKANVVYQKASRILLKKIPYLPSNSKYDITLCSEHKFIWFRVPKVSTRSIIQIFKEYKINIDAEHPHNIHYPVNLYNSFFKFAFIRNPWDRIVSCWADKVLKINLYHFSEKELEQMRDFKNFITYVESLNLNTCDAHLRSQHRLIDLNNLDYLGRFENFESDLQVVLNRIGVHTSTIPHKNKSEQTKNTYKDYYNQELIDRVANIYQFDIKLFGYEF